MQISENFSQVQSHAGYAIFMNGEEILFNLKN